ncbi:hypothetical protein ANCCAN_09419 [Ancylostoma caninum]|uniref:Uncharacterized protein n=1 Tax=Ancylostoma caninum TaxID=29170 RepID=A0A368GMT3_ANCCA|nr:hypothetical protein ANCCAN_09419 [Ancylostoma caninum]
MDKIKLFKYSPRDQQKTMSDLTWVLKEGGVKSSDIQYIISHISKKKTRHATFHSRKRNFYKAQLNSMEMQKMLVELLYWDYVLFNFPLPNLYEEEDIAEDKTA